MAKKSSFLPKVACCFSITIFYRHSQKCECLIFLIFYFFCIAIILNMEAAIFQKRLIKMIEYITTKEASEKWNISRRRVNTLCQEGKIPNVARVGNMWLIPSDSTKPLDGRSFKIPNNEVRRFCVSIEEIICEDFVVTADSIEKAIQVAV